MIEAKDYICDIETNALDAQANVTSAAIMPVTHKGYAHDLHHAECYAIAPNLGSVDDSTLRWQAEKDAFFRESPLAKEFKLSTLLEFTQATATINEPIHISQLPNLNIGNKGNVWGNGVDFDKVILESALARHGLNPKDYWHYRQWKDLPTLLWYRGLSEYKRAVRSHFDSYPYTHHPIMDCLIERHYLRCCLEGRVHTGALHVEELQALEVAFERWARTQLCTHAQASHYQSICGDS